MNFRPRRVTVKRVGGAAWKVWVFAGVIVGGVMVASARLSILNQFPVIGCPDAAAAVQPTTTSRWATDAVCVLEMIIAGHDGVEALTAIHLFGGPEVFCRTAMSTQARLRFREHGVRQFRVYADGGWGEDLLLLAECDV